MTLHKAIGRYMAVDLRPLSTVESPAFQKLVHELDPMYKLPGRTYFSSMVLPDLYQETRRYVEEALQQACQVAITTDGWTSRATESYMTVTAHCIDGDWKLQNFVLQTRQISESHTGVNIAAVLDAAVEEWELIRNGQDIPIVTDNASNMYTAVKEAKQLGPHVGCFARVRRIVAFFHRSSTATALLVQKQKLLQLPQHKLIMDVVTRWNSSYDMVDLYLEQQAAVMAVLTQSDVRRNARDICTLSDEDITHLEELSIILKPLSTITAMLCDAGRPTFSLVLPLKERLLQTLPPLDSDSTLASTVKTAIMTNLSSRYEDESLQLYLWQAAALDPRFKAMPTMNAEKREMIYSSLLNLASSEPNKIKTEPAVVVKREPGLSAAADVGPQPGTSTAPPLPALLPSVPTEVDSDSVSEPPRKKAAMEDIFGDIYVTKVEPATHISPKLRAETEIKKYTDHGQTPGIPLTDDPLLWWKANQQEFPLLSVVARRILCVPGTSVPSERVFSTAGDIISAQRASLSPEKADLLIFFKHNMRVWTSLPGSLGESQIYGGIQLTFTLTGSIWCIYLANKTNKTLPV